MKIFVQIAAYRDPQLIPTIENMLENAKRPKNIVIGVARQFHPEDGFDDLSKYKKDKRFRVLDIPYTESKGVCWARNQVQQLYGGEEYTLQIDSHMRFEKNWDDEMIKMIKQLQKKGHKKPLLTGYVSSFDPDNDPAGRVNEPWRMVFDRFTPEGVVFFLPETIPGWREMKEPIPARFYSAHYCFTLGQFSTEVQHDPEFYFHGEEISITVRAYTHGYDLFHSHKVLIWHEYTRKGRTKQWDDDKEWHLRNTACHIKNRQLLGVDGETFGGDYSEWFGTERTVRDYEKYAGLIFESRGIQLYSNIVLMFLTTVSLKKIMNIGLLHSIMIKMKLYIEKILISMKLTDTLMILTDIVKFGENLTQHKNQHIGLFGHTQHLKDGVIE